MRRITTVALVAAAPCSGPGLYAYVPYDDRFGNQTTMDIHVPDNAEWDRRAVMLMPRRDGRLRLLHPRRRRHRPGPRPHRGWLF